MKLENSENSETQTLTWNWLTCRSCSKNSWNRIKKRWRLNLHLLLVKEEEQVDGLVHDRQQQDHVHRQDLPKLQPSQLQPSQLFLVFVFFFFHRLKGQFQSEFQSLVSKYREWKFRVSELASCVSVEEFNISELYSSSKVQWKVRPKALGFLGVWSGQNSERDRFLHLIPVRVISLTNIDF